MSYIHHIPGRLRVRTAALKHPRLAIAVENSLSGQPGIETVHTSVFTGSAVIHYQPSVIAGEQVLQKISAIAGLAPATGNAAAAPRRRGQSRINPVARRALNKAAKAAGVYLLETALERSVVGLIAAIL